MYAPCFSVEEGLQRSGSIKQAEQCQFCTMNIVGIRHRKGLAPESLEEVVEYVEVAGWEGAVRPALCGQDIYEGLPPTHGKFP